MYISITELAATYVVYKYHITRKYRWEFNLAVESKITIITVLLDLIRQFGTGLPLYLFV